MIVDNDTSLAIFANRYLDTLTTQDLIDLVDDPSPEVRTMIARKLQCRGTQDVFDFAELWSKSVSDYQREIAAFILGQLGCLFDNEKKYPFKLKSKPILMNLVNDRHYEVRAAAIAAFGPFIFSKLIGSNISSNGSANEFFIGLIFFAILATTINWWFYNRKGCEKPS